MKLISWNVNGIRACIKKGFLDFFNKIDADIFCLQETKIHDNDVPDNIKSIGALNGYRSYFYGAEKKGYSGVAVFTKIKPVSVIKGVNFIDHEGRVMILEFNKFFLLNIYVPNSKRELERLPERLDFNNHFIEYCEKLRKIKPIIFCGDLNVAHKEIDLANPKTNTRNAGFTIEERDAFTHQLNHGYIDTFRYFNKEPNNYTWWSYMARAREKNIGWRIDYFITSNELKNNLKSAKIHPEIFGSDHCPIELNLEF